MEKNTNKVYDEEELAFELDIYYAGELMDNLVVFQYPLRPSDRPYGEFSELSNVQINQDNSNMRLIYNLDNKSKYYDTHILDKSAYNQSLHGQRIDQNTNYCIGILRNKGLYLNAVSNFIQYKNDFSNMDSADLARKKAKEKQTFSSKKESMIHEVKENPETKWIDTKFFKSDSYQSYTMLERLYFDDKTTMNKVEFMKEKEYYALFLKNLNEETEIEKRTSKSISYKSYKEMPLQEKIEYVFSKVSLLSFTSLIELVENNIDEALLLNAALKVARILKNGNLIVRSEVKYRGGSSEIMGKRNYLINILQNSPAGVLRNEIYSKFMSNLEMDEILKEISYTNHGRLFLIKNDIDNSGFIKKFNNIYKGEIDYWDSIQFKRNPTNISDKTNQSSNATISGSKLNKEIVKNTIHKIFNKNDCLYFNHLLSNTMKELNIKDEQTETKSALVDLIHLFCYSIDGTVFLKDIGDGGDIKLARNKMIEILAAHKHLKKSDIKSQLKENEITIPDSSLNKLLKSVADYRDSVWTIKKPETF